MSKLPQQKTFHKKRSKLPQVVQRHKLTQEVPLTSGNRGGVFFEVTKVDNGIHLNIVWDTYSSGLVITILQPMGTTLLHFLILSPNSICTTGLVNFSQAGCHYQPWLLQKRPLLCCCWSKALLVLIYVVVRLVEALTFFLWKVFLW